MKKAEVGKKGRQEISNQPAGFYFKLLANQGNGVKRLIHHAVYAIPHREIYEHRDFAIASECKNPLLPVHRALPSPSLPTRKLQEVPATVMLANTFARDD